MLYIKYELFIYLINMHREKQMFGIKSYPSTSDFVIMGGKLLNGITVRYDNVEEQASRFMTSAIPNTEYLITGSFRRKKTICGDIELVIPCETMSDYARIKGSIAQQFGCTKSSGAKMSGLFNGVQFDLFPVRKHQMGSMILHTTGSWKFNKRMREEAIMRGLLLNQYGLFKRSKHDEAVLIADNEKAFFTYLEMKYIEPKERV